jgi:four helix bundle protein
MDPRTVALQQRTAVFAAQVIALCDALPNDTACQEIAEQLIDAAGSVDSNYRAVCRGKSPADFISKLAICIEESDEAKGWLELLVRTRRVCKDTADPLIDEADQFVRIFTKSRITAQRNKAERDRLRAQSRRRLRRR